MATRDSAALGALVDDLLTLAAEMGYDPTRDMGAAPLNLASKRFNRGTLPTPEALREPERDPGPFSVHRYLFPQSGVPTFAGARVAIWPEDLVAGDVDVAIIGVPHNMSSGRRDAGNGPNAMRATNTIATPDAQSLIRPLDTLSVVDYGNFNTDRMSTERSVEHVTDMVAETAATGAIPMLVGGDTSMLYPGARVVARTHGNASFGLLHLSAHPDAERNADHTISDRQALFLLINQGIVSGADTIQVGLRGPAVDVNTLRWLRDRQVRYHTMAEVEQRGWDAVLDRVVAEASEDGRKLHISFDIDVLDPAFATATGTPVPGGINMREAITIVRRLCAESNVVSFDLVELHPALDPTYKTTLNSTFIIKACLTGLAMNRKGLTAKHYLSPLASEHALDNYYADQQKFLDATATEEAEADEGRD